MTAKPGLQWYPRPGFRVLVAVGRDEQTAYSIEFKNDEWRAFSTPDVADQTIATGTLAECLAACEGRENDGGDKG
jgi:hypothetical protein